MSRRESVVPAPLTRKAARDKAEKRDRADTQVQSLRIVVADDNVDAALTLAALLGMQGHDVRTAHDGIEALDEVMRFEPQVVVLDIGMPGMNGYKVAAAVREYSPHVLLIALTGWGQEEDRHRSKAAGFDHHLVKPVDFSMLAQLLEDAARGRTLH